MDCGCPGLGRGFRGWFGEYHQHLLLHMHDHHGRLVYRVLQCGRGVPGSVLHHHPRRRPSHVCVSVHRSRDRRCLLHISLQQHGRCRARTQSSVRPIMLLGPGGRTQPRPVVDRVDRGRVRGVHPSLVLQNLQQRRLHGTTGQYLLQRDQLLDRFGHHARFVQRVYGPRARKLHACFLRERLP